MIEGRGVTLALGYYFIVEVICVVSAMQFFVPRFLSSWGFLGAIAYPQLIGG